MAIKRPDIYEHNNPRNAIADSDFVRGGTRTPVADLSELYDLSEKIDQLKERSTRVYVISENAYYELVDISNVGNSNGWQKESVVDGFIEEVPDDEKSYVRKYREWVELPESESFNPANYDLDEFKNQSANPYARMEDIPEEFQPDKYDLSQFQNNSQDPFVRESEVASNILSFETIEELIGKDSTVELGVLVSIDDAQQDSRLAFKYGELNTQALYLKVNDSSTFESNYKIIASPNSCNNSDNKLPEDLFIATNPQNSTIIYRRNIKGVESYLEYDLTSEGIVNTNEVLRIGDDVFVVADFSYDNSVTSKIIGLYNGAFKGGVLTFDRVVVQDTSMYKVHGSIVHRNNIYLSTRESPLTILRINPYDLNDMVRRTFPSGIYGSDFIVPYKDKIYTISCQSINQPMHIVEIDLDLWNYKTIFTIDSLTNAQLPFLIYKNRFYIPLISNKSEFYIKEYSFSGEELRTVTVETDNQGTGFWPNPHWMTVFNEKIIVTTVYENFLARIDIGTFTVEEVISLNNLIITDDNSVTKDGNIYLNAEKEHSVFTDSEGKLLKVRYNDFTNIHIEIDEYLGGEGSWGSINPIIDPEGLSVESTPPFDPSEHDLDEFQNASADPYARTSDIPLPFDPTYLENDIQNLEDNKVDKDGDKQLSDENYTTAEKDKLAGLESSKFVGQYSSYTALTNAHPTAIVGSYAYVDEGVGVDTVKYIWDSTDSEWILSGGVVDGELTPAQVKSLYESNPDTNAFTDSLKSWLHGMTAQFTTALKNSYDNVVTWISTNGSNLLSHLSRTDNPHEVTKAQVGLGNVDNTSDLQKPISTLQQAALDLKANDADISAVGKSNDYNDLDNIPDREIGGRNYLLNSNFKTTSFNGWSTIYGTQQITQDGYIKTYTSVESAARIQKSFTLSEIGTFTFSVKVKTSVAIDWSGWDGLSILDIKVKQIEDDFEIHSITFSNSIAGTKTIRGYQPNAPIGTTTLIEWEQLEKGNIATDWTPAPEDLVTDWDETNQDSFSFLKNKPTIPDEFDPSEHDLDEFKNESTNPYARMDDLPPPFDPTYLENNIQNLEDNKVDKDGDKQLSDENYTHEEKTKLADIEAGAQVNVIPDWAADTENPRRIDNKPTHLSQFVNDGDKTSPFATLKDIYRTNIVLNYGIVNIEGTYQYDLWADRYIINNVLYTEMLTGSVTLSSPHPSLDRIDKIVIHSSGEFRVKEGVPALNPVSPQVDAQTEVEVRFILVKGGSTEPETDVYRVYDENEGSPNEWTITNIQGNIDPDNEEYASRGTKSIKFGVYFNVSRIQFSPAEPIPFEDFSELLLDVRADDDHNMFILQINDVFIDQLVHGVRGFVADGNFHTVSFSKDEILARFEQDGAPTDEGINEIHLWQDNNTHDYWVDNIRLVKDDSGGSPQPVKIQRTSEIPINDGATGVSPYAEVSQVEALTSKKLDKVETIGKEEVYAKTATGQQTMREAIEEFVSSAETSVINEIMNASYTNNIAILPTGTIVQGRKYVDVATGTIYVAFEDDNVLKI